MNYYKSRIDHINLFKPSFDHQNLDVTFNISKRMRNGVLTPICFSFEAIHTSIGMAEDFLLKEYDIGHFYFREHSPTEHKIFVRRLILYRWDLLDQETEGKILEACSKEGCDFTGHKKHKSKIYCNFHYVKIKAYELENRSQK